MSTYLPLFKALNQAKVEYVIVGGLATVLHGYPRFTADIDLVINLEQQEAEKAIKLITSLGLQARLPVDPIPFAELSKKAIMLNMDGETVPVCDIGHLIAMKQKAGRGKDLEDIKYLQAILDEQK